MDNQTKILVQADALVEEYKQLIAEREQFKLIAKERIEEINRQLEGKLERIDSNASFIEQELLQIANMSDTKETKTQRKLELLNGDVIIKKATKKFKNDNKAILEAIKDERKDLVKKKVTTSLDWAKFKKELVIQGDTIINLTTGEVVEIAGLEIEDVEERVEVK